jgi:hypothetical protein
MGLRKTVTAWLPRPQVFFPKSVIISNPGLAIMYWALLAGCGTLYGLLFFYMKNYNVYQPITGEVTVLPWRLQRSLASIEASVAADQSAKFCNDPEHYKYESSSIVYDQVTCATLCKRATRNIACMHPSEASILEGPAAVFVPTFYTNEVFSPTEGSTGKGHYFVPGVEDTEIAFRHRLTVPEKTAGDVVPLLAWLLGPWQSEQHSAVSTEATDDPKKRVKTVFLDKDGSLIKTWEPGEVISMTVGEILQSAIVDEFVDTVSKLSLDDHYVRVEENIIADREYDRDNGPTSRLTGTKFFVDLEYKNDGKCALDPASPPEHDLSDFDGYLACMTIKAARSWTTLDRISVVSEDGAQTNRRYHGLRVTFQQRGDFAFVDVVKIWEWISIFLIWSQIPTAIVYFFVITLLGNLSKVYHHIIHQSLNINEILTGLGSRLIAHSSSFLDLQEEDALNRKNLLDRFLGIFRHSEDLDDEEVKKFVDFVYNHMVKATRQPNHAEQHGVPLHAYLTACTSNEPVNLSMLEQIFDSDRRLKPMEYIFNDEVLANLRREGKALKASGEAPDEIKPLTGDSGGPESSQYEKINQKTAITSKRVEKNTRAVTDYLESWLDELKTIDKDELFANKRRQLAKQGPKEARQAKVCDNGCVYQGEWIGNCRHGAGTENGNGVIYEGQWEANVYHGQGVLEMPNGIVYDGQFFNGKRHGVGFETEPDGTRYEGDYKCGVKSGQGKFFMPDGSTYSGAVYDNKMHGKGTYQWSGGHSYEGQWENDEMHGQGVYMFANGKKYDGQYVNNLQDGFGTFTWPDGRKYEGEFQKNQQHGKGILRTADGASITGTWIRGKQGHCTVNNGNRKTRTSVRRE